VGVDFAVVLGDFVDIANEENIATMDAMYQKLHSPRHYVLGNHDADGQPDFDFFLNQVATGRPGHYSFESGGMTFIVLDGNYNTTGFHSGAPWNRLEVINLLRPTIGNGNWPPASAMARRRASPSTMLFHPPLPEVRKRTEL